VHSCIYHGRVRHRRFEPRWHEFTYGLFLMYLDLDELPHLFDGRWFWSNERPNIASFRRSDYFGDPSVPLAACVRSLVQERLGRRPDGPIRLLTHLRYFGISFNPVSFYFCFDSDGSSIDAIVAEVSNTPWGERYCYVLDARDERQQGSKQTFRFRKSFHVSPFMPMDVEYTWRFVRTQSRLVVHMDNSRSGTKFFDATMTLERRALSASTMAGVLLRHPLMTAKVVAAIYFEAARLALKRIPFFPHPNLDLKEKRSPLRHSDTERSGL
jgi:DUF1365 family protein